MSLRFSTKLSWDSMLAFFSFGRGQGVSKWPKLPGSNVHTVPILHTVDPFPPFVDEAYWEAYPYNPPRPGDPVDTRPDVLPKPTWQELMHYAALHLRQQDTSHFLRDLYEAYETQLAGHVMGARTPSDVRLLRDYIRRQGRSVQADLVEGWDKHLYQRLLEANFAIRRGNDETIVGMRAYRSENWPNYAWDDPEFWSAPRWRFHPSLPPFDKHDNVLTGDLVERDDHPPSDIFIDKQGPIDASVLSIGPASVTIENEAGNALDVPVTLDFRVAGRKRIRVRPSPPAGHTVLVRWTAYGEEYEKKITLFPAGADAEG